MTHPVAHTGTGAVMAVSQDWKRISTALSGSSQFCLWNLTLPDKPAVLLPVKAHLPDCRPALVRPGPAGHDRPHRRPCGLPRLVPAGTHLYRPRPYLTSPQELNRPCRYSPLATYVPDSAHLPSPPPLTWDRYGPRTFSPMSLNRLTQVPGESHLKRPKPAWVADLTLRKQVNRG
jgi:hypothetical protein